MIDPKRLARLFLDEWQDTEQPIQQRGTILPLGIYEDGSAHLAVPGLIQDGIEGWNALWNDAQAAREGAYPTFDVEQGKRSAGNSLMAAGLAATGGLAAGLSRAPRQSARPVGMTRNEATAPIFDAEPIPQGSGFGSMPYEARSKHWPHSWGPKDLSRWDSETIDRARKFVQREEARERWEPMVNELMWPGGGPMAMHRWEAEAKLLRDRPDLSAAADEWHSANMNFYEHTHPNWQNDRYAALNLPKYPGTPPPSTDVLRDMTLKGVLLPDGSTGADRMARLAASVDPAKSDSANLLAANPKTSGLPDNALASNAIRREGTQPVRAYRGNRGEFIPERQGDRPLWASQDAEIAQDYGDNILPLDLRFSNPMTVTPDTIATWREIPFEGGVLSTDELAQVARQRGHDGLILNNVDDGARVMDPPQVYAALRPGTVFSATTGEQLFSNPKTSALAPMALSEDGSDDDFLSALLSRYGVSN